MAPNSTIYSTATLQRPLRLSGPYLCFVCRRFNVERFNFIVVGALEYK